MVIIRKRKSEEVQDYLQELLAKRGIQRPRSSRGEQIVKIQNPNWESVTDESGGFNDFDLSEFPLFSLQKKSPGTKKSQHLVYQDAIRDANGDDIIRTWTAYSGPFGFGGATTHLLLFDLLQLFCEQGARGSQIQFGTLRSLLMRRGTRNPL